MGDDRNFVSQAAFEFTVEKMSQHTKRLVIIIIFLILALVSTNVAWIWYESQFDTEYYSLSTDGGGNANYIGESGDIINGESNS